MTVAQWNSVCIYQTNQEFHDPLFVANTSHALNIHEITQMDLLKRGDDRDLISMPKNMQEHRKSSRLPRYMKKT